MKASFDITGTGLKLIAMVTMLIDHIGAGLVEIWLKMNLETADYELYYQMYQLDIILRRIGRVAFPIFCFLLVEGFLHTKNVRNYAIRLLIVAIISEVPFDYLFFDSLFYWNHNDVLWELFLGLIMLYMFSYIDKQPLNINLIYAMRAVILFAAMGIAHFTRLDYGEAGVCCISSMYYLYGTDRFKRLFSVAMGVLILALMDGKIEIWAAVILIPMFFYQGRRGFDNKALRTVFYLFYPAHIIALSAIAYFFLR